MTVTELVEKLKAMPQEAEIYVSTEACCSCFCFATNVHLDDRGLVDIQAGWGHGE